MAGPGLQRPGLPLRLLTRVCRTAFPRFGHWSPHQQISAARFLREAPFEVRTLVFNSETCRSQVPAPLPNAMTPEIMATWAPSELQSKPLHRATANIRVMAI